MKVIHGQRKLTFKFEVLESSMQPAPEVQGLDMARCPCHSIYALGQHIHSGNDEMSKIMILLSEHNKTAMNE